MFIKKMTSKFRKVISDQRGEGYIDFLIKILMTVVIGSLLMGLLKLAIPDIFDDIIGKIESLISA